MATDTESQSGQGSADTTAGTPVRSLQEQAARKAQASSDLTPQEVESATDYFLGEEVDPPTALRFQVNMAAAGLPARWIWWTVRTLDRSEIKQIRREVTDPNTGREDDMELNFQLVLAASTEPDFHDPRIRGKYADPGDLLRKRIAHKPGLIEAIARKVNEMSGYGAPEQNIRLVDAAGN